MNRLAQTRVRTVGYCREPAITANFDELKGEGVFDWAKEKVRKFGSKRLTGRPKVLNDLLKLRGNNKITHLQVCREPISGALKGLMNVISLGSLNRRMKKMGYDKLYHLWMAVYLDNGEVWNLEKNQRVGVKEGRRDPKRKRGGECTPLKSVNFNLREFIEKAERNNPDGGNFYRYSPFKYNCQRWVRQILNINGIKEFDKFIQQDTSEIVPKVLRNLGTTVTDIAGVVDYTTKGGAYMDTVEEQYMEQL